ncbi:MAG: hypothetical protein R2845_07405 [Thermomicrobiales bacterium]
MAEVGSMAMELLAAPYLEETNGGFYSAEDARRARREHLESVLFLLTWVATVDAFQHWLYTSGKGGDRTMRDAAWQEIAGRFSTKFVRAVEHGIAADASYASSCPLHYIEYAIAQLGALQVWRNSLNDQAATEAYRAALALGNTRPLPELFEAAGVRFAFDAGTIGELATLIEDQLALLDD